MNGSFQRHYKNKTQVTIRGSGLQALKPFGFHGLKERRGREQSVEERKKENTSGGTSRDQFHAARE